MTKQEHIEANAKYISDDSLAALEQAPESAWETIQAAADALDASDIGTDCEVAATHETMEDFENSRLTAWAERGKRVAGEGFVIYENFQITKGARRQSLAVIDCGEIRIALTA